MSGNIVTFVAAGSCTMAADQAGNVSYAAAPQVTQLISVSKLAQTIELTSTPPSPAYINGTYTVGATGGGSGKPVVITTSPAAVCTVSGVKVTFVGVGTCTIGANQAGSGAYDAAAQKTQTFR